MAPPTLYHITGSPPCVAAILTAEEIDLELELKMIEMTKGEHLEPFFLQMNPAHTVPTLDDNGLHLWESRAIMAYFIQQYAKTDKLYPKDAKQRAHVDKMLYFDATTFYSALLRILGTLMASKTPTPEEFKRVKDNLKVLDEILKGKSYAAGQQLTIADISLIVSISTVKCVLPEADSEINKHPNVAKWAEKVKSELKHYSKVVQPNEDALYHWVQALKAKCK